MRERYSPNGQEMQGVSSEELFEALLVEKQNTDEVRKSSKILQILIQWSKHADVFTDGKLKPIVAVIGIAAVALTPFVLARTGEELAAFAVSGAAAALGLAAVAERKIPIISGSEKTVNKWIANWVLDLKKIEIDGEDVARVLLSLPKNLRNTIKSPDEIRSLLENANKNKKDPYAKVARYVQGIIAVEVGHENIGNEEEKKEKTIGKTVRLMIEGQIGLQREIRTNKHITREGLRMGANAGSGFVAGLGVAWIINKFFGSQYGGLVGVADDAAILATTYMFAPTKNKVLELIKNRKAVHVTSAGVNNSSIQRELKINQQK